MDLESLASVGLVGKLLRESLDDVTQTILKSFVHLCKVSLLVKSILHFFHPLGELISQMIQSILDVLYSLSESIEGLLADTSTT